MIIVSKTIDGLKDWENDNARAQANHKVNKESPEYTESLVQQVLLKMFEMEFFHRINVYHVSKSAIRLAEMYERDKVFQASCKMHRIVLVHSSVHSYLSGSHENGLMMCYLTCISVEMNELIKL